MKSRIERVLVTGGAGFLGRALVRRLVGSGTEVVSFSRGEYPELERLGVRVVSGDLADPSQVARAAEGCDTVFHVAAKAGVWGRPIDYYTTNVTGTVNVIAACVQHRIPRLVFTSSPSVVAHQGDLEAVNESRPYPDEYLAEYPRTKAAAERMVVASNEQVDHLRTVCLRPHLIWGPGDNHLVPRIVARARRGRLRLVGDGRNTVDSVYIDNAVDAHLLAAERLEDGSPVAGKVYFITNGEPLAIEELINRILAAAGLPPVERRISVERAFKIGARLEKIYGFLRLRREPPMTRFLAHQLSSTHHFDISAARRELGYHPAVPIAEGMDKLRAWIRGSES